MSASIGQGIHDGPVQDMANIALRLDIVERLYGVGRFGSGQEFSSLKGLVKTIIGIFAASSILAPWL